MDGDDAKRHIRFLQVREEDPEEYDGIGGLVSWRDRRHVATDVFSREAETALTPPGERTRYALIELWLLDEWPGIDYFAGILAADDRGIWWYDGDGGFGEPCWRPTLIPWGRIQAVRLHQVS